MELLLNLAWVLLALPAFWLWRASSHSCTGRKFTSLQCLLSLACILVVLFPVISATDDLHAMRAEMEESAASKRSVRHANSDKAAAWKRQRPPALVASTTPLVTFYEVTQITSTPSSIVPAVASIIRAGRAPPAILT